MVKRIHQLSTQLSNQIAAGEVVERPASVIKELVENSLDAGATQIDVNISQGGLQLIQVKDNGLGIEKEDLSLAVARHATSKIKTVEDLIAVESLGFRGEALASISAVSRFSLVSKTSEADTAYELSIEGETGDKKIQPIAHLNGTTVSIRDLFFNIPARRKFMRAERTEFMHIENTLKRMALSRYDVGFTLIHNDKTVLKCPVVEKVRRIEKVMGKQFRDHALKVDEALGDLRLWGWIVDPAYMRSQNDKQHFYLNGRVIRDKLINHAIRQAYDDKLYEGRQPAYVLHLECDYAQCDVNVHPTKHEVRFRDARTVHDFICRSVMKNLEQVPEVVVPAQVSLALETIAPTVPTTPTDSTPVSSYKREQPSMSVSPVSYQKAHHAFYQPTKEQSEPDSGLGQFMTSLFGTMMLTKRDQSCLLIDCQRAQEAIFEAAFEKTEALIARPLLVPLTIQVNRMDDKLIEFFSEIKVSVNVLDPNTIAVREIPTLFNQVDLKTLFTNSVEMFDADMPLDTFKRHIAKIAANDMSFQQAQMEQVLRDLNRFGLPKKTSRGKTIWRVLEKQQLMTLL